MINSPACDAGDCKYLIQVAAVKFEDKNFRKEPDIYLGSKSSSSAATKTVATEQKTAIEEKFVKGRLFSNKNYEKSLFLLTLLH